MACGERTSAEAGEVRGVGVFGVLECLSGRAERYGGRSSSARIKNIGRPGAAGTNWRRACRTNRGGRKERQCQSQQQLALFLRIQNPDIVRIRELLRSWRPGFFSKEARRAIEHRRLLTKTDLGGRLGIINRC